jgi:hypothetical protein
METCVLRKQNPPLGSENHGPQILGKLHYWGAEQALGLEAATHGQESAW